MVEIKEVKTLAELRKFRDFPDTLYKHDPNFVPDFKEDELNMLRKDKNPAFEYCDARYFLAYRDGNIAGRIGAILNKAANEKWGTKRLRITRVDFIDDEEVSAALFKTVEAWAKELQMEEVQGPLGFNDLDKEGLLIEGFELPGLSITIYNAAYYQRHFEKYGYDKDVDWKEFHLYPPAKDTEVYNKFKRLSELVLKRHNLHLYKLKNMKDAEPVVRQIFELMNECCVDLYGTMPLTPKQADDYYKRFQPLLSPEYVQFVLDENERLVAFNLAAPSLTKALQKNKGRLFPFGFIPLLKALKKNDVLELYMISVKPELRNAGLPAAIMFPVIEAANKNGIEYAESGPELETNDKVQSLWKFFKTETVRRRRCFIKKI
jgi:hypothetical protein